jgi:acetolactate synthase-1/2/3 large subunit
MADGMGGYTEKITEPAEIIPALQRAKKAVDSGKPAFLEVITTEDSDFLKE